MLESWVLARALCTLGWDEKHLFWKVQGTTSEKHVPYFQMTVGKIYPDRLSPDMSARAHTTGRGAVA